MRGAAGVLSLLAPGAGQALRGRWMRGLVWFGLIVLGLVCLPLAGIWAMLAVLLFHGAAAIDAALIQPRPASTGLTAATTISLAIAMLLLFLGTRVFYVEAFKVPSSAMLPTIRPGDHVFIAKYARGSASRGDVIVFRFPPDPRKDFIKRVVAVAGDRIAVKDEVVYLNGQPLPRREAPVGTTEYWDYDETAAKWRKLSGRWYEETNGGKSYTIMSGVVLSERAYPDGPCDHGMLDGGDGTCIVPPGSVFVMGDNRDNSNDSRYWGPVPLRHVKGRALSVWWSSGSPEGVVWSRLGTAIR